ncbi:hypothetical protein EYF80_043465 [Liparis tanakae]|uniref:Uncharacterized protein n=1 Tax=Liparis tanakae TaxID=230148 RepID=A0A4Z2FYS1_9TELE|nr:hypothetical protein EYF80_043465 [Liparis tanakae]
MHHEGLLDIGHLPTFQPGVHTGRQEAGNKVMKSSSPDGERGRRSSVAQVGHTSNHSPPCRGANMWRAREPDTTEDELVVVKLSQ